MAGQAVVVIVVSKINLYREFFIFIYLLCFIDILIRTSIANVICVLFGIHYFETIIVNQVFLSFHINLESNH